MFGATILTAFNDNAAITYLAAQVHDISLSAKHAVVAGAVTGGGLTVIANAPNPAGQSILSKFFKDGVSPLGVFLGALTPTVIVYLCFVLLPNGSADVDQEKIPPTAPAIEQNAPSL
jgi:Na+/H+ antiporter NhaD/arsenite permease-like protein